MQAKDSDWALAAIPLDNLKTAITELGSDISYQHIHSAAKRWCELLNVGDQIHYSSKTMRREARKRLCSLQGCALHSFITKCDSVPCRSTKDQL